MTEPLRRPSVDDVLLHVAYAWAARSTCPNLQVGAVLSRDGRILSTGYNGAPAGLPHCAHPPRSPDDPLPEVERRRECVAVHAEANAVAWAARHGVRLDGAQATTTDTTCPQCAQLLIQAGVTRVVAGRHYRDPAGWQLLRAAGLDLKVLP